MTHPAALQTLLLILAFTAPLPAQVVLSTKSGIVHYIQGEILYNNSPLSLSQSEYPQMENGHSVRTRQGRMELLLGSGIYLRLGENGLVRMEQNQLDDTQIALEQGSALIEVVQPNKKGIHIRFSESSIDIRKAGLYRLNADSGEIKVYGGEANVAARGKTAVVKKNRMIRIEDGLNPVRFDAGIADSLHQWAAGRSFCLFNATKDTRKQLHWVHISLGWLYNSGYRMRFHSRQYFAELNGSSMEKANAKAAETGTAKQEADARQEIQTIINQGTPAR